MMEWISNHNSRENVCGGVNLTIRRLSMFLSHPHTDKQSKHDASIKKNSPMISGWEAHVRSNYNPGILPAGNVGGGGEVGSSVGGTGVSVGFGGLVGSGGGSSVAVGARVRVPVGEASSVMVAVTVGVSVWVAVGRIKPVEVASGVEEGNKVEVDANSAGVKVQVGGSCLGVTVAVGILITSGSGGGGKGFHAW